MDLPDKILILGLGVTGIAAARFLAGAGKEIAISDTKNREDLSWALDQIGDIEFKGIFGGHGAEDFFDYPMIVISPGVDSELPLLKEARKRGIVVVGEIELASLFVKDPIIAITGTNGKTTVTTIIGEIFQKALGEVFVGGNIGNPLMNYVMEGRRTPYVILEVSSFQLETIETFHPAVSVLLNVTEDHLDRHSDFNGYTAAKYRVFENQTGDDHAILNRNLLPRKGILSRKLYFSPYEELDEGAFCAGADMCVRLQGREYRYKRDISPLIGVHNTENLLSALLVSHICNIEQGVIEETLTGFKGLPHRVEPVRTIRGVRFYNDSKATNVDATRRTVESIKERVVLIAGGRDKGGSYRAMAQVMEKVKALVLMGEAKDRIAAELGEQGKTYIEKDLSDAVRRAFDLADEGDMVLFSPMCSSFDMFRDYKERGDMFKEIVEGL